MKVQVKAEMTVMRQTKKLARSHKRAFTLLEVLMVVVILGLLAAFVVPNFFGAQRRAEEDLASAAVTGSIPSALKMYRMHMGRYPGEDDGNLMALVEKPEDEEEAEKWAGPYIEDAEQLKDPWGHEYVYEYPGTYNEDGFDLYSIGPDGSEGTDDDIKNWEES